jgi:hypothetical protein
MIKVTIGESKTQEKPFPKLMISSTGAIWLMESFEEGFYLSGGNGDFKKNRIQSDIVHEGFTDYDLPITIQNA